MPEKQFHDELRAIADRFVHDVYKATKSFPKDELYGVVSQLRRASLSVILNYIEGYARGSNKSDKNFLRISYASLKESEYLILFSFEEKHLTENNYQILSKQADRIGAMLWGTIQNMP
ncbi:MAG: four helix bundle protein [Patescibacteria group bacterium]